MIFTTIWTKIVTVMGAVIAGLVFMLKYRGNKIDDLEEEKQFLEVEKEIVVEQAEAKKEILKDEKVRIKKKVKKKSKQDRRSHLNDL